MGIKKNIRFGLLLSVLLLCGSISSCINDEFEENRSCVGVYPVGTNTYYNLVLHLGNQVKTRGGLLGDTDGSAEENAVNNVAVIFFNEENLFETVGYFSAADLTREEGNGNLGSAVIEGVTFKKAMPIMAGKKTVAVIVNYDQSYGYFTDELTALLKKGVTTWEDFNNYPLDFLLGSNSYPTRLDLPKYMNYKAPVPSMALQLGLAGVNTASVMPPDYVGMLPFDNSGMMMTGSSQIILDAGVTETEATSGNRNLVTLYVDRVMAKASLKFDNAMKLQCLTSPNSLVAQVDAYEVGMDNVTPIEYATWWLANIPASMYLMEHKVGLPHPYYNQSMDFSMWQNKMNDSWSKPYVTNDNSFVYTSENLVQMPLRGNVTYAVIKAKFTLFNIDEDPNNLGYEIISNREWNGQQWSGYTVTHLPFSAPYSLWMLTDNDGKRKFLTCEKSMDNLVKNFTWMLYYPNKPGDVFAIDMMTYHRTKSEQDNAAKALHSDKIVPGWYIFYYDAKKLHTGNWYDEMDLYYYNGGQDALGNWQRGKYKTYTTAYYKDSYCYYRVNLEDETQAIESKRFAIHRNDWFQINIKKIKELGYPDEEDLAGNLDDKLTDSWLEVGIKVQNWRDGGSEEIEIGK